MRCDKASINHVKSSYADARAARSYTQVPAYVICEISICRKHALLLGLEFGFVNGFWDNIKSNMNDKQKNTSSSGRLSSQPVSQTGKSAGSSEI